jgi:hypothetical protein
VLDRSIVQASVGRTPSPEEVIAFVVAASLVDSVALRTGASRDAVTARFLAMPPILFSLLADPAGVDQLNDILSGLMLADRVPALPVMVH